MISLRLAKTNYITKSENKIAFDQEAVPHDHIFCSLSESSYVNDEYYALTDYQESNLFNDINEKASELMEMQKALPKQANRIEKIFL